MSDSKNREGLLLPILIPFGALGVIGLVLFGFSRILLAISHNAATVVALVAAAGILATATIVAGRKKVTGGSLASMVGISSGIAMMIGGLAVVAVGPQKEAGEGGNAQVVTLAAPAGAAATGFSTKSLAVASGEAISLEFDNQDPNVSHNVVVFAGKDDTAPELFKGELVAGPKKVAYEIPALDPGSYFFHCEVHPATMQGVIEASEGGGGSPGGPGVTLVAEGIAFDTDKLQFQADAETVLTFDNRDADIPHNMAIYKTPEDTSPLFLGELITGPATAKYTIPALAAGKYYFHCEIHPSMEGTIRVGESGGGGGGGVPSGSPSAVPSDGAGGSGTASIAAAGLTFDTSSLSFPANEPVTLTFDNTDDVGTTGPHNVAIYKDDTLAEVLFQGELVSGPATIDYQVPALAPGEYYFQCDVHPPMNGTVSVA
ncbi:MAG: cupredoxin domain-containing protein [Actinomycetota bacterium]